MFRFAQNDSSLKTSCQVVVNGDVGEYVHLIYTDIVGLRQIKRKMPALFRNYKWVICIGIKY